MDFKAATDRLVEAGVTLTRLADEMRITLNSVSRMRSGTGRNQLRPPDGWQSIVARLAREHAKERERDAERLRALADELER